MLQETEYMPAWDFENVLWINNDGKVEEEIHMTLRILSNLPITKIAPSFSRRQSYTGVPNWKRG